MTVTWIKLEPGDWKNQDKSLVTPDSGTSQIHETVVKRMHNGQLLFSL